MLHGIADHLAQLLLDHSRAARADKDIYVYGFEILISTTAVLLSILIASALFCSLSVGVVFLCTFLPLRVHAGGYHAQTYAKCYCISMLSYLIVLAVIRWGWALIPLPVWGIGLLICSGFVAWRAPVENAHQPLSETKRRKNHVRSVVIVGILLALTAYLAGIQSAMACVPAISIFLVAFAMLMGLLLRSTEKQA